MERIARPAWILCTPRCGSSYLCELLNNTGKFEPVRKERAFGEWLKYYESADRFKENPPLFNKCTAHQFRMLLGEITRQHFEVLLPGVRYVLMRRRDLYAQTVSMYFAKTTDQYHIFSARSREEYLSQKVEFDEVLLLKLFKNASGYHEAWNDFLSGSEFPEIFYEDLISDPPDVLKRVCRHLNVDLTDEEVAESVSRRKLIPTTRPETGEFVGRLKALTAQRQAVPEQSSKSETSMLSDEED